MKPNQTITREARASGHLSVLAGWTAGCIALGLAVGLLAAGLPWLALSAGCYALIMIALAFEAGRTLSLATFEEEDTQ